MKKYPVEIQAQFNLKLDYVFSADELTNVENIITDAFDCLETEIQSGFDTSMGGDLSIEFCSGKRRRKDNTYKLDGSFSMIFEFYEKDIDDGELIDGVFDSQLSDMKTYLENGIEQSGYDMTIVDFSWASDGPID